ncbi:MAG: hypothetical protein ABFR89_07005 [Actinomycetota bacterium]
MAEKESSAAARATRPSPFDRFLVAQPLEDVLRFVVVFFRVGAYVWMATLTIVTFATDDAANRTVVAGALVLATVWTAFTLEAGRRRWIGTWWFLMCDGIVVIALAIAPGIANSSDFFYGGMPLSWLFVAAYTGGSLWTILAAFILSAATFTGAAISTRDATPTSDLGLVLVFVIPAIVIAWTFDTLRYTNRQRAQAEEALEQERAERIRQEERADVATRLHDSVLQTLSVIEGRSGEPETRHLARRERHAVRRLIDSLSFGSDHSFKGKLLEIADGIEDAYLVNVESAFVGNTGLDDTLECLCAVTKEALVNAAKHSGCDRISLFAEVGDGRATATVKDEGGGIPDSRVRESLEQALITRLGGSNGRVVVRSAPGTLTVVEASVERRAT